MTTVATIWLQRTNIFIKQCITEAVILYSKLSRCHLTQCEKMFVVPSSYRKHVPGEGWDLEQRGPAGPGQGGEGRREHGWGAPHGQQDLRDHHCPGKLPNLSARGAWVVYLFGCVGQLQGRESLVNFIFNLLTWPMEGYFGSSRVLVISTNVCSDNKSPRKVNKRLEKHV